MAGPVPRPTRRVLRRSVCLAVALSVFLGLGWLVSDAVAAAPPTVTTVSPSWGPAGTSVTVNGTNLSGTTVVSFGSTVATGFTVGATGTSLTVLAPAGSSGTVDITLTTPGGGSGVTSSDYFTYTAAPPLAHPTFGFAFGTAADESPQAYGAPTDSLTEQYAAFDSWAHMVSSVQTNAATWATYGVRLVLGVGIIPTGTSFPNSGNLSSGTLTSLKSSATSIAQSLVAAHIGNAMIRLGWEFNGNW